MVDLAMRKELTSPFYGFHKLTAFWKNPHYSLFEETRSKWWSM